LHDHKRHSQEQCWHGYQHHVGRL